MNEPETQDPGTEHPREQQQGSGSRSGCGIMMLIVAIIVILTVWPMIDAWSAVSRFEQTARDAGYSIMSEGGVALMNDEPVSTPTYFRAIDSVQVLNGAQADIAISSGDATLDGVFTGNVAFLGRDLTLLPGAVILGDLEIAAAKYVTIRGTVEGEIWGDYRRLFRPQPIPEPGENPDSTDPGGL